MKQTPINEIHNDNVLRIIPNTSEKIIEIGCSSGALAREFKNSYPNVHWVGVEIDPDYAELAKRHCDTVCVNNIEECNDDFFFQNKDRDCWIFADVLEHLKDPWAVLRKIRSVMPLGGCVIACIPNAQNWSVLQRLVMGNFRYEDQGLLDRTHLRWFTRKTIVDLFLDSGFAIESFTYRSFFVPDENLIKIIRGNCGNIRW